VHGQSGVTTYLFTDIEGSTRLWELEPARMRPALARHDALSREAVEAHGGSVVKTTGDGIHAVFSDPLDALHATVQLLLSLNDPQVTHGVALHVRSGMHVGADERRDNDYYGPIVNRAARIMNAAHGGQILLSHAVVALISERLPEGVALRNLGAVWLRGLTSPELVYQVLHPKLRQDFPALRSLESTPNNLPQQVTTFIGREHELAEVKKLLADTRLLTLLGVGGLGKTRLSLQVATEVLDDYPDGVWFVELAPLVDARLVPQSVATALGVKEEAGHPVVEALVKHVKDRQLLIILDNCEHLMSACAELAKQLLQSGPQLKILTSSREPLHLLGETTFALPALAVPDASEPVTLAALAQYEAVRLFAERATAVQSAFRLTEQNAPTIIAICRRLDGIPLAIELAAARVRALSVETIADRLSDRFCLLTQGERTALPRQQTLRALIDWSYDLLANKERAVFCRLGVFAGSFTLEAAEDIAACDIVHRDEVLDLLTLLVDKSLVVREPQGARYRLLDTVLQYARERLGESAQEVSARAAHLEHYLDLAEKARPELLGPNQAEWLARLDADRENLLSMHLWCDSAANGAESGLRLVRAVRLYWIHRGLLGLGHRVTLEALSRKGAQQRNLARCRGLFDAGQLCNFMGRYAEALGYLKESLAIARELGDKARVAAALQPLGWVSFGQGDLSTARIYLEEALELARALGNQRDVAAAMTLLGQLYRVEGAVDKAQPLLEQVLAIARELQDRESIAIGLLNLAMLRIGRGAEDQAPSMLVEAIEIAEETGSRPAAQSVMEVCAGLAVFRGEASRAAQFYGAAENQTAKTGSRRDPADEAFLRPLIAQAQAALGPAAFAAAENSGRTMSHDVAIANAREWLKVKV
jgi:predicted ATPase/class 3 adenylate cyclase